jgi:glycyl-tRNA synthetase beta chain
MVDMNIGNFLLELGAEELPAGQIRNISNHIKEELTKALNSAEISFVDITTYTTPRRLAWYISEINLNVEDKLKELKGPPEKVARAEDGSLSQAGLGFIKKNNLTESQVKFENGYLCASRKIQAQSAESILEASIPTIIANTPGTRFMRWANGELKFARPIQWLVALVFKSGEKTILNIDLEGLKASSKTLGHRFLAKSEIEIESLEQYISELKNQGVYIDREERKSKIIADSNKLAETIKGEVIFNDELLDEITLITENPSPILCEFSQDFLTVPDCVLQTVMIHHQRYLPIQVAGKLSHYFIAVSNNPLETARQNIKAGNEKVIIPRFKDAEFFVQEDSKTKLKDRLNGLERLNSLKGTMLAKSKRLEKISEFLARELMPHYEENPAKLEGEILNENLIQEIKEAALISKTDLGSNLVFEFTELQGEIGGIYAKREGYSEEVSKAIAEQYRPRFAGDDIARTIGGKILAIADKLDNLVCAFALGKIPSGSADPFALRRQANGLLETILHSHFILDVTKLVAYVVKLQEDEFGQGELITKIRGRGENRQEVQVPELEWEGCTNKVVDFLEQRLEFVFSISHKDSELVKVILAKANPLAEINKRHMMYHTILELKQKKEFSDFVAAVTRIFNIAKNETEVKSIEKIDTALFELNYEKEFLDAIKPLDLNGSQDISYTPILNSDTILKTIEPINKFFDNVLVNAEDEKIKHNRKTLVAYASTVFKELGDFTLSGS